MLPKTSERCNYAGSLTRSGRLMIGIYLQTSGDRVGVQDCDAHRVGLRQNCEAIKKAKRVQLNENLFH